MGMETGVVGIGRYGRRQDRSTRYPMGMETREASMGPSRVHVDEIPNGNGNSSYFTNFTGILISRRDTQWEWKPPLRGRGRQGTTWVSTRYPMGMETEAIREEIEEIIP